jgi:regulator of sigma D
MNPLTDIIFSLTWAFLLVWAVRSVLSGWNSKAVKNYNANTWKTKVTKRVHPEMTDVKPGDQLMGVTFDQKTECDLEEYKELQDRISKLKEELEDSWDDEDDDGDIVTRL